MYISKGVSNYICLRLFEVFNGSGKCPLWGASSQGNICRACIWSGKCPLGMCLVGVMSVGHLSDWGVWSGKCPSGMCLVGEVSIGNVLGRGNVCRGSVRRGKVRRGNVRRGCVREPCGRVIALGKLKKYITLLWVNKIKF